MISGAVEQDEMVIPAALQNVVVATADIVAITKASRSKSRHCQYAQSERGFYIEIFRSF
jgi:hypothetical protein